MDVPNPSTACCGPCNNRWRRAERARLTDGTPHELIPRAGAPVWCNPCARHLRTALADLPELAARLLLEIRNGTSAGNEHVSGSRERPLFPHQNAAFLIDDIAAALAYWSAVAREERDLAEPPPRPRGAAITADTRLLLIHFDWLICEHPEPAMSTEFGSDIGRVHHHATALTHTNDVRPQRCDGVPCPRCDLKALEHELDRDGRATGYIVCRSCDTLLSPAEYERWLKMVAAPLKKRAA